MKTFKAMCATAVLALSLSIPGYADSAPGDQHSPGRTISAPGDTGTPTTTPESSGLISAAPLVDGGTSFPTFADILWALASIY
jgi:hypothetical protein